MSSIERRRSHATFDPLTLQARLQSSNPALATQCDPFGTSRCDSGYITSTASSPWTPSPSSALGCDHRFEPNRSVNDAGIMNDYTSSIQSSRAPDAPYSTCRCLQRQAQLVYQLSVVGLCSPPDKRSDSVERVLEVVKIVQAP
jgi:hypothetical protein